MDTPTFLSADATGVFTRCTALAAGHTDRDLRDWVSHGTVRRVHRGIFATVRLRHTDQRRCSSGLDTSPVATLTTLRSVTMRRWPCMASRCMTCRGVAVMPFDSMVASARGRDYG